MSNTSLGLVCFPEDVVQGSEITVIFLFLKVGVKNSPLIVQRSLDHGPLETDNVLDVPHTGMFSKLLSAQYSTLVFINEQGNSTIH